MNLLSTNNIFKNTMTPFMRNKKIKFPDEDHSINDKLSSRNINNKTIEFQKNDFRLKKPRIFSTKNADILSKLKNIKSATIKFSNINNNLFPNKLKKDKMSNTGISFYRNNKKQLTRNYSAYYIKSDLQLDKKYVSDFLVNNNNIKKSRTKIADIEQKINKLGKTLNVFPFKKNNNNSLYLNHSFSCIPYKRIMNKNLNNNKSNNKEEEIKNKNLNLPDYLKNEFNIKGTKILSPFCIKARDIFILKKLTYYFNDTNNLKTDKKYINNKLNIIYAENEEAYNMKLSLLNKK